MCGENCLKTVKKMMRKYGIPEVRLRTLYCLLAVHELFATCRREGARQRRTRSVNSRHERPKSLLMARLSTTFPSKTNSRESSRKWMAEDTTQDTENNALRQERAQNDVVRQRCAHKDNTMIERPKKESVGGTQNISWSYGKKQIKIEQ